jgi:hypothetical protein
MATHDYVISNASGAAVRADLNNALAAIVTHNSSATEPTTTYSYMLWADTGSSPPVMKLRNAANNGWVSLFQLDGEWSVIPFENGTAAAPSIYFKDSGTDTGFYSPGTNQVGITTAGVAAVTVDASQRVGIGTTSVAAPFHIKFATDKNIYLDAGGTGSCGRITAVNDAGNANVDLQVQGLNIILAAQGSERARIDSSGRLLVGTSTAASAGDSQYARLQVAGNLSSGTSGAVLSLQRTQAATAITANQLLGEVEFTDSAGNPFANIFCASDAAAGSNDYPGRLVFSTTADGASSPTERMRIDNAGNVFFNTTNTNPGNGNVTGAALGNNAGTYLSITREGGVAIFNRKASDGTIVELCQDGTTEGTISVSGTTVSYNGAHLSRWSQLPGNAERTEILRGTVLSNINEMCGWGDEDNEQLNRMKVSDVEGDPNVSGVFQAWDDDDDTYTDDFYCAMTGDFIIRIAENVTVQRGDLLMSAGDGTAKPQDDDIIRSKTVAKVTSTHVTCTYDDGSYCVPCVLMAC